MNVSKGNMIAKSEEKDVGDFARVRKLVSRNRLLNLDSEKYLGEYGVVTNKRYVKCDGYEVLVYTVRFKNMSEFDFHNGHIDLRWRYSGTAKNNK